MRIEYFFGFIISFIVGVALESVLNFGFSFGVFFLLLSIFVYLVSREAAGSKGVLLVSLLLFGCAAGIFRVDVSQLNKPTHALDEFLGKTTRITGIIIDEPDVREEYTNIVLEAHVLDKKPRVLMRMPVYTELAYGDEVVMTGKIMSPQNFAPKDNAKAFDYVAYLAKDGIYYQMYFPDEVVVSRNNRNIIRGELIEIKDWLIRNISQNISEPEASLAAGITLGAKQSLGDVLLQKFRETGVAHIVVLSGYNIAVVAGIVSRLVMFMPFALRLMMSAFGILLFATMVGGGATVVRATIMALVVILSRMLGRESDALRVLVLAGWVMVFVNPTILLYDVSFQLSFSATLALVVLVPVIEKYFLFLRNRIFREIVITTFATQIFVLPLILYHMGTVSLVGFVANLFILPAVPFAMLVTALVSVFAWVPIFGELAALSAHFVLAYIVRAVEVFSLTPFASLSGISFSLGSLVFAYAVLAIYIFKNFPRKLFQNEDKELEK